MNFPGRGYYRGDLKRAVSEYRSLGALLSPLADAQGQAIVLAEERTTFTNAQLSAMVERVSALPSVAPLDMEPGPSKMGRQQALQSGYTGNQCVTCNSLRMKISGHCEVCEDCGSSSGCS